MDSDRQAISDPALSDKELRKDTIALFKFVTDTLDRLTEFLRDRRANVPKTSYAFIQSNIETAFEIAAANVKRLRQNADAFSSRVVSWPLILRSLHGQEERQALFDFRDDIVEHSAALRQASFDFTTNISLAFAGYTLVYEILENFGVSVPFILIESNSFSEADLQTRLFSEYAVAELFLGATGPRPSSVPIETLTYFRSGNAFSRGTFASWTRVFSYRRKIRGAIDLWQRESSP